MIIVFHILLLLLWLYWLCVPGDFDRLKLWLAWARGSSALCFGTSWSDGYSWSRHSSEQSWGSPYRWHPGRIAETEVGAIWEDLGALKDSWSWNRCKLGGSSVPYTLECPGRVAVVELGIGQVVPECSTQGVPWWIIQSRSRHKLGGPMIFCTGGAQGSHLELKWCGPKVFQGALCPSVTLLRWLEL